MKTPSKQPLTLLQVLLIMTIGPVVVFSLLTLINPDKFTLFLVLAGCALILPLARMVLAFLNILFRL